MALDWVRLRSGCTKAISLPRTNMEFDNVNILMQLLLWWYSLLNYFWLNCCYAFSVTMKGQITSWKYVFPTNTEWVTLTSCITNCLLTAALKMPTGFSKCIKYVAVGSQTFSAHIKKKKGKNTYGSGKNSNPLSTNLKLEKMEKCKPWARFIFLDWLQIISFYYTLKAHTQQSEGRSSVGHYWFW